MQHDFSEMDFCPFCGVARLAVEDGYTKKECPKREAALARFTLDATQATERLRATVDGVFAKYGIRQIDGPPMAFFTMNHGDRFTSETVYRSFYVGRSADSESCKSFHELRGRTAKALADYLKALNNGDPGACTWVWRQHPEVRIDYRTGNWLASWRSAPIRKDFEDRIVRDGEETYEKLYGAPNPFDAYRAGALVGGGSLADLYMTAADGKSVRADPTRVEEMQSQFYPIPINASLTEEECGKAMQALVDSVMLRQQPLSAKPSGE